MEKQLPQEAIDEDRRLVAMHERSGLDLHRHRWHWTLDESNPNRVTLAIYARAVELTHTAVRFSALTYAMYSEAEAAGTPLSLSDAGELVRVRSDQRAALIARGRETGQPLGAVRRQAYNEAKYGQGVATSESPDVTRLDDVRKAPLDAAIDELDRAIERLRGVVRPGAVARQAAPLLRLEVDKLSLIADLAEATAGDEPEPSIDAER